MAAEARANPSFPTPESAQRYRKNCIWETYCWTLFCFYFLQVLERVPRSVSAYYSITEVIEMGKMASMFFNRTGKRNKIQMSI